MKTLSITRVSQFRETVSKVVAMLTDRGLEVTQEGVGAFVHYDTVTGLPKRVNIPVINDNADEVFLSAVRGFIDHECAHVLFSNGRALIDAATATPRIKAPLNILEDVMIERRMCERFPGSAKHIADTWTFVLESQVLPSLGLAQNEEQVYGTLLPALIHAWGGKREAQSFLDRHDLWSRMTALTDRLAPMKAKIAADWVGSENSVLLAQEMLDLLRNVAPPAPPEAQPKAEDKGKPQSSPSKPCDQGEPGGDPSPFQGDDEPKEKADQPDETPKGEGESEGASDTKESDEEGDGKPKGEGDADPEGESSKEDDKPGSTKSNGKGEDQGDGAEPEKGEGDSQDETQGDAKPETPAEAQNEGEGESDEKGKPSSDEGGSDTQGDALPVDEGNIQASQDLSGALDEVSDFEKALSDTLRGLVVKGSSRGDYMVFTRDLDRVSKPDPLPSQVRKAEVSAKMMEEETSAMTGQLSNQFRRLFAAQEQILNVGGMRSGRLQANALHRLALNDDRVFYRREEHTSTDTAVSLVIDCSGSMNDDRKIDLALTSAYAFSNTLERVGIKHEVLGFTTRDDNWMTMEVYERMRESASALGRPFSRHDAIQMLEFKTFDEQLRRARLRFATMRTEFGYTRPFQTVSNIDGESVLYAAERLIRRPERRKVMVVFSDGMPAGAGDGAHLERHLKQVVKEINQTGIETLGIGIKTSSVQSFYPKNVVLHRAEDLPQTVMREISAILLSRS
jgi:Mg-chelatase subunit ChlD